MEGLLSTGPTPSSLRLLKDVYQSHLLGAFDVNFDKCSHKLVLHDHEQIFWWYLQGPPPPQYCHGQRPFPYTRSTALHVSVRTNVGYSSCAICQFQIWHLALRPALTSISSFAVTSLEIRKKNLRFAKNTPNLEYSPVE